MSKLELNMEDILGVLEKDEDLWREEMTEVAKKLKQLKKEEELNE